MKSVTPVLSGLALSLALSAVGYGQASPTPTPQAVETPATSADVSIAARKASLAKLLEGQRYAWTASRTRNRTRAEQNIRAAKAAYQQALEIDPKLAEAYTALAELEISLNPTEASVAEAISLAEKAVDLDPRNFGARRLLGRLYSYNSRIGGRTPDPVFAKRAVAEWLEVVKLDPRNAEGWAFLSAFYEKSGEDAKRIDALRKWRATTTPLDGQFYQLVLGRSEELSTENASVKLADALIKGGESGEAIEILSNLIADNPENSSAIETLTDALQTVDGKVGETAIESLQKAVYANPDNLTLTRMLGEVFLRAGRTDDGVRMYEEAIGPARTSNPSLAANLYFAYGEFLSKAERFRESAKAFRSALDELGVTDRGTVTQAEREFTTRTLEALIAAARSQGDANAVRAAFDLAERLLGPDDLFAERQRITYFRDSGKRTEALETVRRARKKAPADIGLVRLEATLLAELGRVDEAVRLIKGDATQEGVAPARPRDEFSDLLFISSIYTDAKRGADAAAAAEQALAIAQSSERKMLARLTYATAKNSAGDFAAAEATLKEILEQSPRNPIALNNLGYFLLERNERLEEARAMIERAVEIDPTNPSFLDSLGWAYFKLGQYSKAELYLKEAARQDPGSSTIQEHLGDVYEKTGQTAKARAAWERAIILATDQADRTRIAAKLKK